MIRTSRFIVLLLLGLAIAACAESPPQLANPASQNCLAAGGRLVMEQRPSGTYGVCLFEDNRQCEEWALLRGRCPAGGLRVAGYATEASRYCAITGGTYRVTAQATGTLSERGTCALPDGWKCDAQEHYLGTCPSRTN